MNVLPTVVIQRIFASGKIEGVRPEGVSYTFDFDNLAGGPFTLYEELSWGIGPTAGTGVLNAIEVVGTATVGKMTIVKSTGELPVDNLEITGSASSAKCDVDGDVDSHSFIDSVETMQRGRLRMFTGLLNGGLLGLGNSSVFTSGYSVKSVFVSLPGVTTLALDVRDIDGVDVSAGSLTLSSGAGFIDYGYNSVLIPPGFDFKVSSSDVLTSMGQVMFVLGNGWGDNVFRTAPQLGYSERPPSMVRG